MEREQLEQERPPEEKAIDNLTKTQEFKRPVTREDLKRVFSELASENEELAPIDERKAVHKLESLENLNTELREHFSHKKISVRGSWEEFEFDEVIFDPSPEGSFPYKVKLKGLSNPSDTAVVDDKSLKENFKIEDKQ